VSKSFPTIASTEIDGESPVTETLVGKFYDRDESLISAPVDTRFGTLSTASGAFVQVGTVKLWLPASVGTAGGNVTLVVVFEARVTAGATTGRVRMRLGAGGTYQETGDITSTTFSRFALTITAADVAANADAEVDLEIEGRVTAGAGSTELRCVYSASRLERAA
jgi:hypothetical protein